MFFRRKKKKKSRKERLANSFRQGFSTQTHRSAWSILKSPFDMIRQNRESGEDPAGLKAMSFEELMAHWGIPLDQIPRLKRTLVFEMLAYVGLAALGLYSLGYTLFTPAGGFFSAAFGVLVALIAILQFLFRRHWYTILAKRKYLTFREYILGEEE